MGYDDTMNLDLLPGYSIIVGAINILKPDFISLQNNMNSSTIPKNVSIQQTLEISAPSIDLIAKAFVTT